MKTDSRLKDLRKKANLTQDELAQETGFARSTISWWECDISTISLIDAEKLANYFHVSLPYLLKLDPKEYTDAIREAIKKINPDDLAEFIVQQLKKK